MTLDISSDGKATIHFNQELMEQRDVNITQHMRFQVSFNNDEVYQISCSLLEWQRQSLIVDLGISEPLNVSRKTHDVLTVTVTNKEYFVSNETSYQLSDENLIVMADIPRQLPKEESLSDLLKLVDGVSLTISIGMILSTIVQLILKQKQSKMQLIVITFQIIGFVNIYRAQYPTKVEIVQNAWREIVTFQNLNLKSLRPYLENYEWFKGIGSKIDESYMLKFVLNMPTIQ